MVRIILKNISIDVANQVSSTIEGDLSSRDTTINSIAFYLMKSVCLIHSMTKRFRRFFAKSISEINLLNDPLRILRCFRFIQNSISKLI